MAKEEYVQIETTNSWGYLYYYVDRREVKFTPGQQARILWPNGVESLEEIVVKPYLTSVSDHGKSSTVQGRDYYVKKGVHDAPVLVHIASVKIHREDITLGEEIPKYL